MLTVIRLSHRDFYDVHTHTHFPGNVILPACGSLFTSVQVLAGILLLETMLTSSGKQFLDKLFKSQCFAVHALVQGVLQNRTPLMRKQGFREVTVDVRLLDVQSQCSGTECTEYCAQIFFF